MPRGQQKWAARPKLTTQDETIIDRMPAFAALAQKHGYSPSEFLIVRRMEMLEVEAELEEQVNGSYKFALDATQEKPNAPYMEGGRHKLRKQLEQVRHESMMLDIQLLPYEKPKLRSMEVNMSVESKSLADYLKEANERRTERNSDD